MAPSQAVRFFPERDFDFLEYSGDGASGRLRHVIHTLDRYLESGGGLMVAVKGDWGTGKTSILKALQSYYHDHRGCPVLFFEAWKYQNEQNPLVPLMHQLAAVCEKGGVSREWVEALKRAAKAALLVTADRVLLPTGAGVKNIKESLELVESLEDRLIQYRVHFDAYFGQIEKIIDEIVKGWHPQVIPYVSEKWHAFFQGDERDWNAIERKPFILIIDDLDRCLPEKGFALLEAVRFYLQLKGTLVLAGVNDQILIPYIEKVYASTENKQEGVVSARFFSGADFLEKIFQAGFELSLSGYGAVKDHYFKDRQVPPDAEVFLGGLHLTFRKWVRLSNRLAGYLTAGRGMQSSFVGLAVLQECLPEAEAELRKEPGLRASLEERSMLEPKLEKLIQDKAACNPDVCAQLLGFLRELKGSV